jgi:hypothetical protein
MVFLETVFSINTRKITSNTTKKDVSKYFFFKSPQRCFPEEELFKKSSLKRRISKISLLKILFMHALYSVYFRDIFHHLVRAIADNSDNVSGAIVVRPFVVTMTNYFFK